LLMAGLMFMGCGTFFYQSSKCRGILDGCNAIYYCGTGGCAGYFGGKCNCQ
jgi:hypothetical protein